MKDGRATHAAPATGGEGAVQIAATIEDEIVTGALGPGRRLSEVALGRRFGVGRAPVREALRLLEGRRLVQRTPHAGPRVVELRGRDVDDLLHMREVLEGLSARLAAERIALEELNRLDALLAKETRVELEGLGAVFGTGNPDNDFHCALARAGGNGWLAETLTSDLYALLRLVRFRAASTPDRARLAHAEHEAILQAVRRREPDRAETLMREHVRRSRKILAAALAAPS